MKKYIIICAVFILCGIRLSFGQNTMATQDNDIARRYLETTDDIIDKNHFVNLYRMRDSFTSGRRWFNKNILRLNFLGGPCDCYKLQCECTSTFHFHGFNKKTVITLVYDPNTTIVTMNVRLGQKIAHTDSFKAKEAAPRCIPIPMRHIDKGKVKICIGFYNMTIVGGALRACMAVDSRIYKTPLMVLFFNCMYMGENIKPEKAKPGYPKDMGHSSKKFPKTANPVYSDSESITSDSTDSDD